MKARDVRGRSRTVRVGRTIMDVFTNFFMKKRIFQMQMKVQNLSQNFARPYLCLVYPG